MRITVDTVMALCPCAGWTRRRVKRWFGSRRWVLARTALRDKTLAIEDRVWLGIVVLDPQRQRLFACDCAERALTRERDAGREPDPRSWRAVEVSRRYAVGKATDQELGAAKDAAWDAARYPAWNAARDAARYPARFAARDAAGYSARFAAWDVADAGSGAAEHEWQIARLVAALEE